MSITKKEVSKELERSRINRVTFKPKNSVFKQSKQKLTYGQKLSDNIAKFGGSWTFIIWFLIFLVVWMIFNMLLFSKAWDPYPFILLNLALSTLAAIQAPVILMSQNRAAERDRIKAERDYYVNRKAEREIENIQQDLDDIKRMINNLHRKM